MERHQRLECQAHDLRGAYHQLTPRSLQEATPPHINPSPQVQTIEGGRNSGRSYYFGVESEARRNEWVNAMNEAILAAKRRLQKLRLSKLDIFRARCREIYKSDVLQCFVAVLIAVNFITNIIQNETLPLPGTPEERLFNQLDLIFTGQAKSTTHRDPPPASSTC